MTALPDSIIQNGLFCCWKYEERNERKTKVPYQPETGLGAKSNDPSSFVPYKTAVQASGYDGIGIGVFNGICAILSFYDNFVFDDWCGLHANFRADDALKESFYNVLTDGRYDQERFNHGKYRTDFMNLCRREDGSLRDYEEYLKYQNIVGAKYCGVNFLKPNLIEVRTLNLCWSDVEFFIDAYEEAKKLTVEYPADAELLPAI